MRNAMITICILALLFLAGCFDSEERLVIKEDMSGTVQMRFAVEKSYLEQMKVMYEQMAKMMPEAEMPSDPIDMMFNKAEIEQALADDGSGVELVSYETSESENLHIWDMKFTFEDVNQVAAVYNALSPEEDEGEVEYVNEDESDEPLWTKQADGTWLFYRSFEDVSMEEDYSGGDDEYSGDEWSEEHEEYSDDYSDEDNESYHPMAAEVKKGVDQLTDGLGSMAESVGKHKMLFVVTFPGDIVESNATSVDGRTATWEYTLEQLDQNPPAQKAVIK